MGIYQVELHGSYSVERFISMQKYRDSTSVQRSLVLLGSIPLLSLACAAVVDAFPLESPDLGLAHIGTLWARGVLVTLFDSYALSWMFDQYVPQLEISRRTLIVTAIAAAVVVQASALILILLLWYPLPFTLIWISGPWIWTLALALKLSKGEFLRKNPQVLNEVRRFSTLLILTTSTGLVYVAFNVIFQTVPAEWQTPAAVLVPVFKVIQKNVICRLLRGQDDVKPEIVNFNVDVTNALFISSIMQNLQSVKSSAMLVVVDFVQMLTSLFDLRLMLKDIRDITNESTDQAIACALVIVGKYPELGQQPLLTRTSTSDIFRSSKVSLQRKQSATNYIARITSFTRVAPLPVESNVGVVPDCSFGSTNASPSLLSRKCAATSDSTTLALVEQMTTQQRRFLLHKVLQIMFFMEFFLLTELLKALIPVGYS
ncbi:hypothetical protein PR003_g24298 [Phytophthora rubi]|uniref:Uncharacterized protein n=1 Tax=Phytophthora rubi TaxID=129364 RepID=A0A6A4CN80_9STRA|nr:hypothetical protein PR003_g24298 [Phytophthora rubi]